MVTFRQQQLCKNLQKISSLHQISLPGKLYKPRKNWCTPLGREIPQALKPATSQTTRKMGVHHLCSFAPYTSPARPCAWHLAEKERQTNPIDRCQMSGAVALCTTRSKSLVFLNMSHFRYNGRCFFLERIELCSHANFTSKNPDTPRSFSKWLSVTAGWANLL